MVTLQQVEELRKYADISFNEAREALEETQGDILEAIINLEKKGRIKAPKDGGFYSSKNSSQDKDFKGTEEEIKTEFHGEPRTSFSEMMKKFGVFTKKLFNKGNRNSFEVMKNGNEVMSIPVTILVVLALFTFWITIPLMFIGLFFGYKYTFKGPELGKEKVNRAMDSVSNAAENLKKEFKGDNEDV